MTRCCVATFGKKLARRVKTPASARTGDAGGLRCRTLGGVCTESGGLCIGFLNRPVLSEWQVASIEITRPDPTTKVLTTVVITPTPIAQDGALLLAARR
jgi:hypothetical protein